MVDGTGDSIHDILAPALRVLDLLAADQPELLGLADQDRVGVVAEAVSIDELLESVVTLGVAIEAELPDAESLPLKDLAAVQALPAVIGNKAAFELKPRSCQSRISWRTFSKEISPLCSCWRGGARRWTTSTTIRLALGLGSLSFFSYQGHPGTGL